MEDRELCLRACAYAVAEMMEKGSSTFATSTIDDPDTWVTCEWSEVLDWIAKEMDKE